LKLYSVDDLRHLDQTKAADLIKIHDGIVSRAELRAVILRRLWWERFGYSILLTVPIMGALRRSSLLMRIGGSSQGILRRPPHSCVATASRNTAFTYVIAKPIVVASETSVALSNR
jgi:hypothetical protein